MIADTTLHLHAYKHILKVCKSVFIAKIYAGRDLLMGYTCHFHGDSHGVRIADDWVIPITKGT